MIAKDVVRAASLAILYAYGIEKESVRLRSLSRMSFATGDAELERSEANRISLEKITGTS